MPVNDGTLKGWPFVNHSIEQRSTQTHDGPGRAAISVPRPTYTYIIEFQLSPQALDPEYTLTNLRDYMNKGRLFVHSRSVSHPETNFTVETLRSYNRYVKVPTKAEFPPATMTFYDDTTSLVMSLWKEYYNFYHHMGDMGSGIVNQGRLNTSAENNTFRNGNPLVGDDVRSQMDVRPSIGLRLKTNDKRIFFENIVVYDLGTEPDSINVYYMIHPIITSFNHDALDMENRTGFVGITMNFEFEAYYSLVGQKVENISDIIEQVHGMSIGPTEPSEGHAVMGEPPIRRTSFVDEVDVVPNFPLPGRKPDFDLTVPPFPIPGRKPDPTLSEIANSSVVSDATQNTLEVLGGDVPGIGNLINNTGDASERLQLSLQRDKAQDLIDNLLSEKTNIQESFVETEESFNIGEDYGQASDIFGLSEQRIGQIDQEIESLILQRNAIDSVLGVPEDS